MVPTYRLDLDRCRRALAELEIEGELGGMPELARATGLSISTVCRFFSGRLPSTAVIERIVGELRLTLDEVVMWDDDQDGTAGVGARS